jgi:poly(3-hydroxybutyrate) depolymerase
MHRQGRFAGLASVTLALGALSLACSGTETSPEGTGGGSPAGSGGASGSAGAATGGAGNGNSGTTGGVAASGGKPGAAGRNGAGTGGAAGGSGGNATGGAASSGGLGGRAAGGGGAGGAGTGGASAGAAGASGAGGGMLGPSPGCGAPTSLMSGRASIDVSGKMREYILALPDDYDPNQPYRLIFGWHPWGGSAEQIANGGYFGLEDVVEGQAILVAPEGQDYQDNGLGWGNEDGEDIDFLHAMLDRFGAELCIDQDRIFSTGFSFGAMFSFTLACTEDSRMRAIAPQAGNAITSGRCEDGTRSVATMAFIGTDDTLLSGHRQAVDIFAERNGCSMETMPVEPSWCDELASSFEPCTCVEYQGCKVGYPVIECEYAAGHQFAPSAGPTLWSFFSQF